MDRAGNTRDYSVPPPSQASQSSVEGDELQSCLAAIVESSEDAIVGTTLDGVVTSWNSAAERLYGYAAGEIVGSFVSLIIPPERSGELSSILQRVNSGERIHHYETERLRKDGSRVEVSVSVSPITDASGQATGAVGIARDVSLIRDPTERNRATEALRDSEDRFRSFFDNHPDAVLLTVPDASGTILAANPAAQRMFGATEAEIIAMGRAGIVDASDPRLGPALEERARTGKFVGELTFVRRDGTKFPGEITSAIFHDSYGRPRTSMVIRDITERMRDEEERERLIAEVRELARASRRRAVELRSVLDNMVEAVFVCDDKGQLTLLNRAARRLLALDSDQIALAEILTLFGEVRIRNLDGSSRRREDQPLIRALTGETLVDDDQIVQDPKRGRDIYIRTSAAPIRDEGETIVGAVAVARDVTELTELERQKDQFLRVAAHELKTPITIMKGYAQALIHNVRDVPPERRRMVDAISLGADRMDDIVQGLLDIARLQEGHLDLKREEFDLSVVVTDVADRISLGTTRHGLRHELRVQADEILTVRGDRQRIEQVLNSLVDNAIRYSPGGGVVKIAAANRDGEAVVSVTDEGIGIPAEMQSRIFQRFFRAHTGTKYDYGGIGIDLFISREIIHLHGGRMWFESREGSGSTFYFALPLDVTGV